MTVPLNLVPGKLTRCMKRCHPERYSAKDLARVTRSLLLITVVALGCDDNPNDPYDFRMVVQPKYNPLDQSRFFADGQSARSPVEGTIPTSGRPNELPIQTVSSIRSKVNNFPFPLTRKDIEQGRELFNIYCAVCHGATGDGTGMIYQRGFTHPPSFYQPRLRQAQPGHFYDVISNGYAAMYSYNDRISPDDRWRITGYVRALQLSDPNNTGVTPPTQHN
jgi:cytochrome c553